MSDYLGNLAARSLGLAQVLQPRLESLFEPPRANAWAESNPHVGPELPESDQNIEVPAKSELSKASLRASALTLPQVQQPADVLPTDLGSQRHVEQEARKPLAPGQLEPTHPTRDVPRQIEAAPFQELQGIQQPIARKALASLDRDNQTMLETSTAPVARQVESAPMSQLRPTQKQPAQKIEDRPTANLLPRPISQVQAIPQAPARDEKPAAQRLTEAQQEVVLPKLVSASKPEKNIVRPQVILAQPIKPMQRDRLNEPIEQIESPVEPIVHVTIGRIEVRAITPVASPKSNTPVKSIMSLDDYLQQARGSNR